MTKRVSVVAVLLGHVLLAGFAIVGPVIGQQPDVFEVLIPAAVLNTPAGDGAPLGELSVTITAFSGPAECTSADTTSGQDVVLRLGEPGQPAACGIDGSIVTFVDARCHQMATKFVLRLGERKLLDNLAPLPPDEHAADCTGNPNAGFGPFFDLVMPLETLQEPVGFNDPVIKTFGQFAGGYTAYADGVMCVREDAEDRTSDLILRLGHADQPAACAREGARVSVIDDYCRKLIEEYTLILDADVGLTSAVAPPGTPLGVDCVPRMPASSPPSPSPAVVVPGGIAPPSVGSGGLLTAER